MDTLIEKYEEITKIFNDLNIKDDASMSLLNSIEPPIEECVFGEEDFIMSNMRNLRLKNLPSIHIDGPNLDMEVESDCDIECLEDGVRFLRKLEGTGNYLHFRDIIKNTSSLICAIYVPTSILKFNINFIVCKSLGAALGLLISNTIKQNTEAVIINGENHIKYEFMKPYIPFMVYQDGLCMSFKSNQTMTVGEIRKMMNTQTHVYVEYVTLKDLLINEIDDGLYAFRCDYTDEPYIHYNNYDTVGTRVSNPVLGHVREHPE